MTNIMGDGPVFALVDDNEDSAQFTSRVLLLDDPVQVVWVGDGERGKQALEDLYSRPDTTPDLIIVDLKAHPDATAEFIAGIGNLKQQAGVPVAALAPNLGASIRNKLLVSGADAVFERHHDLESYRAEMARLIKFWVRETATWPIRA